MKEKNSKRVVIIEDIDSDSIEQAIFILRNNGVVEKNGARSIVHEAERIINAYVQTLEKTRVGVSRKEARSRRKKGKISSNGKSVLTGLICIVMAVGLLVFYFRNMVAGL